MWNNFSQEVLLDQKESKVKLESPVALEGMEEKAQLENKGN